MMSRMMTMMTCRLAATTAAAAVAGPCLAETLSNANKPHPPPVPNPLHSQSQAKPNNSRSDFPITQGPPGKPLPSKKICLGSNPFQQETRSSRNPFYQQTKVRRLPPHNYTLSRIKQNNPCSVHYEIHTKPHLGFRSAVVSVKESARVQGFRAKPTPEPSFAPRDPVAEYQDTRWDWDCAGRQ